MHEASSALSLGPGGLDLSQPFLGPIHNTAPPSPTNRHTKITIGTGNVGIAIAQAILTQGVADEIAIIDATPEKLSDAKFDLQHAAAFVPRTTSLAFSSDFAVTSGSDLIIITAGACRMPGESGLNLLQRNVALFKNIVPELVKHSPDAILLVVSKPVDILTYVAWQISGFPPNRVIGSGTNMDSSKFRFLLANYLDVNVQDVQAYIVGGHGDSSVVLWSSVSVGGVPILSFLERRQMQYEKVLESIHMSMDDGAGSFRNLKRHTSWAIGYSVASLARTILLDQRTTHPVSVNAKGFYGIDGGDVFLSLPVQLGRGGVVGVSNVHMTDDEVQRLKASAETLLSHQSKLGGMAESYFKQELGLEERRAEAARLREKYPDRIPVIVEKAERSDIPNIDKKKYLIPAHLPVGQFTSVLRKRIKLSAEEALFIFVDNILLLPRTGAIMSAIYEEKKDEDGFLYVTYRGEKHTFGLGG